MSTKYVYRFSEGDATMRNLLGGKGANLCEMVKLGLPVPEGFIVTTEACNVYGDEETKLIIDAQIEEAVEWLQHETGKKFGDLENPLLVSVRSGAPASMPGMMDTILNLGINDQVVRAFEKNSGNRRFAYDSYRRFIQMFSDVVMQMDAKYFEDTIDALKERKGVKQDIDLDTEDMVWLTEDFKEHYRQVQGVEFPQDPKVQLMAAVKAVFNSWNNERAIYYRKMNNIPDFWGTAVNVVEMVFGNMGMDCGTGVCFSRNPSTGEHEYFYGEYLINAQGEDVVAGIRTPQQISKAGSQEWAANSGISEEERAEKYPSLEELMPEAFEQLDQIRVTLEEHYRDMQDMEFTIERGKLYMLQTRNGKRTGVAALKIAVDLVTEGLLTTDQALMNVEPERLDDLLHPTFEPEEKKAAAKAGRQLGKGLAASPGAACGQIVFNADDAKAWTKAGKKTILVRQETSPEDIEGMHVSEGVLTIRGGMTSHAAVVARGMGRCCVSGCGTAVIDEEAKTLSFGSTVLHEGDVISLDGSDGTVYDGALKAVPAEITGNFETFMKWADLRRRLSIRANADTPADAARSVEFGAEGIGLVRTEHMFFNSDERIAAIRKMIVSRSVEERKKYLAQLLEYQRSDFIGIFEAMGSRPVTIRLIDPPLHEFLPKEPEQIRVLAADMGMTEEELTDKCDSLREFNPMMGHRGCRLIVTYPEIGEMQTTAIIEAALEVNAAHPKWHVAPEIMVPLVGESKEFNFVKDIVMETADRILMERHAGLEFSVGTMIEVPRAAMMAADIAKDAQFFSFGTNDLTQMTFGFSRDDAGAFLGDYYDQGIYPSDPFAHIDQQGVGRLIIRAIGRGRAVRPNMKMGVCGEHGGDPQSIEYFDSIGLNYVSCSPYRVPIARLAAAQATIKSRGL